LKNEELHNLYNSSNIKGVIRARIMRWAGNVACMGKMRSTYRILVRKREGRRLLARSRSRWEDNIRLDLKGNRVGRYGMDSYVAG
jgi:hypothetical protein